MAKSSGNQGKPNQINGLPIPEPPDAKGKAKGKSKPKTKPETKAKPGTELEVKTGGQTRVIKVRKVLKVGRAPRRKEEDVLGLDYVGRMEALGARDGESFFTFRRRMVSLVEGRRLWVKAYRDCEKSLSGACRVLGLQPINSKHYLELVGLTTEDLILLSKTTTADEEGE
jgi:hypothetical protein